MVIYYVPDRQQSFTVTATTEVLTIDPVSDGVTEWEVPRIEACIRTDAPKRELKVQGCAMGLYEGVIEDDYPTLRWTEGYRLTFRAYTADMIEVLVEHNPDALPAPDNAPNEQRPGEMKIPVVTLGDRVLTPDSLLYIPYRVAGERTVLPLRGYVSIGDVPDASDSLLLLDGRYEIKQNLGLRRDRSHLVGEGRLFPGDRISFALGDRPWFVPGDAARPKEGPGRTNALARVFVTDLVAGGEGFDLVATTEPAYANLLLTRVGGQPTLIPVPWTERLLGDGVPVAIATLLGLIATMIALSNAYFAPPKAAVRIARFDGDRDAS